MHINDCSRSGCGAVSGLKGPAGRAGWETRPRAPGVARPPSLAAHAWRGPSWSGGICHAGRQELGPHRRPPGSGLPWNRIPPLAPGTVPEAPVTPGSPEPVRPPRRERRTQPRTGPAPRWAQQARCRGPAAPSGARMTVLICSRFRRRRMDSSGWRKCFKHFIASEENSRGLMHICFLSKHVKRRSI